jgi:uncharacterized protein YegP (UPF0339 family)
MTAETKKPLFRIGPYDGWRAADRSFYYTEVGGNGEVMNSSQLYETLEHAEEGARSALVAAQEGSAVDEKSEI